MVLTLIRVKKECLSEDTLGSVINVRKQNLKNLEFLFVFILIRTSMVGISGVY